MAKVGLLFGFDEPKGWEEVREGTRYVYVGPNGAELIVSASLTAGAGAEEQRALSEERSFRNALDAAVASAADPALRLNEGLTRRMARPPLEIWTVDSITADGKVRFLQAIARAPGGVMFVTYECPESPQALTWFESFLESIHLVEPSTLA